MPSGWIRVPLWFVFAATIPMSPWESMPITTADSLLVSGKREDASRSMPINNRASVMNETLPSCLFRDLKGGVA